MSEPVPGPPQRVAGPELFSLDLKEGEPLRRLPLARGHPVYEFRFGNREGDTNAEGLSFWFLEEFLEAADVAPV